jgi:hypothetical protein
MKRATSNVGWAMVVAGLVSMAHAEAQKGKPLPPPNWPCVIVFGDASTDMIRSDREGPEEYRAYADGVDGVQCYVNRNGGGNDGNLFVNASQDSPRSLVLQGNMAISGALASGFPGYATFENRQPGYFEITDIHDVKYVEPTIADPEPIQAPNPRRLRVGVQGDGQFDLGEFWGDGSATDTLTSGSDSATVIATGPCEWSVAWESGPGRVLALREGINRRRVRTGDFQLPFTATVTVTGVKEGCAS